MTADVESIDVAVTPDITGAAPAALFTLTDTPALVAELPVWSTTTADSV
jgi:hypothetical protein